MSNIFGYFFMGWDLERFMCSFVAADVVDDDSDNAGASPRPVNCSTGPYGPTLSTRTCLSGTLAKSCTCVIVR